MPYILIEPNHSWVQCDNILAFNFIMCRLVYFYLQWSIELKWNTNKIFIILKKHNKYN